MGLLHDEAKNLPPPGIVNRNSVWLGFTGWATAMLHNAINRRPAIKAGVHRQALFITIGWVLGYHLTKIENYKYSKLDRDMKEYIRMHPVEFPETDKKTFSEIVEPFHPIR
ncbi:NADH dehydrogenase [ubiquinone] 1 subunit C2-like [Clarias magur]|uniref:NADH dehydrogenase [ubiquinone] 1 subunit C2 n=1 Tax=Clarias magur TaxID=1594786 RepID=A0A8J4TZE3_CLAMG|nr:NADH dehydrogenase [ubiquinone] 1 subunit C2-like [Clarias magur]